MKITLTTLALFLSGLLFSQTIQKWDDTQNKNWPMQFKEVNIPCSIDGENQKAMVFISTSKTQKPLIVSLHTWSGDYTQEDPLIKQIMEYDWNYIHPDFRGVNNTAKACGSKFVVSDIDDAISYALENMQVDPDQIHVIGVSGGGFATMLSYMKSKHDIRTFSAWAGISNLVNWYYESLGRKNKYAGHIALATSGDTLSVDIDEAKARSPFFMQTPVENRINSKLFLYAGVHDGYTGSVPISQTIDFYNKVVNDWEVINQESKVSGAIREILLRQQMLPDFQRNEKLGGRYVHYQNSFQDKVYLTVFEGTHEMLTDIALNHIPSKKILVLGDSNGALTIGWVNQLKKLRPDDFIINTSVSGNTIGFDNLNNPKLNTLKMLDSYLQKGAENDGAFDCVLILLGTNDCKLVFDKQLNEVPANLEKLISNLRISTKINNSTRIVVVSPPPYGKDEILLEKYKGGEKRADFLTTEFAKIAEKMNAEFVDVHTALKPSFDVLSNDGVHLSEEGQKIIAKKINAQLQLEWGNK